MTNHSEQESATFVVTKGYRRFAELCDACRRSRFIGLAYGPQGRAKPSLPGITHTGTRWNRFCRSP